MTIYTLYIHQHQSYCVCDLLNVDNTSKLFLKKDQMSQCLNEKNENILINAKEERSAEKLDDFKVYYGRRDLEYDRAPNILTCSFQHVC